MRYCVFPTGRRRRPRAVYGERRNRKFVALLAHHDRRHALHEIGGLVRHGLRETAIRGDGCGHFHLVAVFDGGVDGRKVLLDDLPALLAVRLFDGGLDLFDGLLPRQHAGNRKVAGLHDGVDPAAHAGLLGDFVGVDNVESELFFYYRALDVAVQVVPDGFGVVDGVEQEHGARGGAGEHVVLLHERELVARHELGVIYEVRRAYRIGAEAQVRNREAAALLGVVHEVRLGVVGGSVADDFNGVFVRADRAVRAEPEEHRAHHAVFVENERFVVVNRVARDIVVDADREVVLGRLRGSVVKHALDHRGGELLGAEPVPAAEHDGVERARQKAVRARLGDGRGNFLVEGLAHCAELLCPVEDGDDLGRLRNGRRESLDAERAEHSDFEDAELFALGVERLDGLLNRLRAAAHYDDYLFGVGRALVLVRLVDPAGELAELVHLFLYYVGAPVVIGIARLPRLEEHVGILRGAADERPVGVERAGRGCREPCCSRSSRARFRRESCRRC